ALPIYPGGRVCAAGILQPGGVCEKAGPGAACCNDTCSPLTCVTPTPTATVTPTSTAVTPTRTATPIRTATPATTSGGGTPLAPTATPIGGTPVITATATATPAPTSTPLPLVQPKSVLACERALGRASTTLVAADVTTIERCGLAAFSCIQSKPAGADRDACIAKAQTRCAKKLTALD